MAILKEPLPLILTTIMKSILKNSLFGLPLLFLVVGCNNDEAMPLVARAGESQMVTPLQLVTLDGSKSSGSGTLNYSWTYQGDVPEAEIDFQNATTVMPTFTPPTSGVYTFTLTVQSDGSQDMDQVTVVAFGGLEIGGVLTEDLALVNIEADEGVPDYTVTSDLEVPTGITLSVAEENVLVYFESGIGLKVSAGGTLTNQSLDTLAGIEVEFTGPQTGWKGIWVDNGSFNLQDAVITNAGGATFDGQSEAAAITFSGLTLMEGFYDNTFESSLSYDLKVEGPVASNSIFGLNEFSFKNPVKAPVDFLRHWNSIYPNVDPESMEYHIMIPSGADKKDNMDGSYIFSGRSKYHLTDDFWVGESGVILGTASSLYFKEGSGLLSEGGVSTQGTANLPCELKGVNGAEWTGIVSLDTGGFTSIQHTFIDGAGNGAVSIGGFTAEEPAFFYGVNPRGDISFCTFSNLGGFGFYNADTVSESTYRILSNDFGEIQKPAIRTNVLSVQRLFFLEGEPNVFDLPAGVPAVLVQGTGAPISTWDGLSGSNFYFIDTHIKYEGSIFPWTLDEGVRLTFKDGDYYEYDPGSYIGAASIIIKGTAENPVIFDSESGTPGSWGGIFLRAQSDGWWQINHLIVRNGGGFILPNATEKANVSVAYSGSRSTLIRFTNSTVEDSDGYGIVVEANTIDYGYDDPSRNNIFNNNASGDVLVK